MSIKSEIVASIEAAQVAWEQARAQLAELRVPDGSTVRTAAYTLGNYLNINMACLQMLEQAVERYQDPEVQVWLQSLSRTSELMIYVARQLTNGAAAGEVPLHFEKVDLARGTRRLVTFWE